MKGFFSKAVLGLEEWDLRAISRMKRCETLELSNRAGAEINESDLADALAQAGPAGIKSLVIRHSSKLRNLTFLKALPGLETLQLYGSQLQSLDGLEWFKSGRVIEMRTEGNRKRDIRQIAETPIIGLTLQWANPGDLEAIARSRTIRNLGLWNCPKLSFDRWREMPGQQRCHGHQRQIFVHRWNGRRIQGLSMTFPCTYKQSRWRPPQL